MIRSRRATAIPTILLISLVWAYWKYAQYVILIAALLVVMKAVFKLIASLKLTLRHSALRDIDSMDGIHFEHYVADILRRQGYTNVSLTERYDYGVDIVAYKEGVRWGIQVKRYTGLVKANAVRQAVTGLQLYGCDRAMVITNSTFSTVAKRLAEGNGCVLIDRAGLYKLIR